MRKLFPARCLRGLRNSDHINRDDGSLHVMWNAFEPSYGSRDDRVKIRHKTDHYECSINWDDHKVASFRILSENANAKHGIASVRRRDLMKVRKICSHFQWERDPEKSNKYHGNLLFSGTLSRPRCREIAAVIANCVQPGLEFTAAEDNAHELEGRAKKLGNPWRRLLEWVKDLFS